MKFLYATSFGFPITASPEIFEGHAGGLKRDLDILSGIYDDAIASVREIGSSKKYTTLGKKDALVELGKDIAAKIEQARIDNHWPNRRTNAEQLEARLRKVDATKRNDLEHQLRAREIRDHFNSLNEIQKMEFIQSAIQDNDSEIVNALRNAPIKSRLLAHPDTQKLLADFDADELKQRDPEVAAELASILEAEQELNRGLKMMVKALHSDGVEVAGFDPIQTLAGAEDDTSQAA